MTRLRLLGLRDGERMPALLTNTIDRIVRYPFGFVLEKLQRDGRMSSDLAVVVELEFRRFIALVALDVAPIAMISPLVDEVWHQFVLFSPQYRAFCHETVGFFIDHQPDTEFTPVPIAAGGNFVEAYRRYFGDIPQIWFEGLSRETLQYFEAGDYSKRPPMRWSGWPGRVYD